MARIATAFLVLPIEDGNGHVTNLKGRLGGRCQTNQIDRPDRLPKRSDLGVTLERGVG